MCQSTSNRSPCPAPRLGAGARSRRVAGVPCFTRLATRALGAALPLLGLLSLSTPAQAQMTPRGEHILSQGHHTSFTSARLQWSGAAGPADAGVHGEGLALKGHGPWPRWEGRIGAVIDRPMNPVTDSFVLAQPVQGGLRMRSVHVLSDYYVQGGFRATLGLVSGEAGQAWWSSGDTGGGLNLSLQQLDSLGNPFSRNRANSLPQATPYLGAGYSTRTPSVGAIGSWRFNADFGLINTNNLDGVGDVLQGERPLGDLVRGMRLRPLVKVSVGYAF